MLARRARARAGAGAAAAPGGDPRARPGDRRRPRRRRRRGNLPAPSTSFVGREEELDRGRRASARAPPRDADRAARRRQEPARRSRRRARSSAELPDGIWLVDFARAGERGRRRPAARARRSTSRGSDPLARVDRRGFGTPTRCSSSTPASTCSRRRPDRRRRSSPSCPGVRVLATSREALHVAGEVRLSRSRRSAARRVELFLERARAARPGFEPDDDDDRARRRDRRGASTACRSRSSSPPRASNVLGLGEIVSILERRAALLHDGPALRPEPQRAPRRSSSGATTSCTATRRRCSSSSPSTAAARRSRRSSPSPRRTASTRRRSRISSPRSSTSRSSSASFAGRRRPLRHARHRPRVRARRASPTSGGARARPRARTPEYFATLADEAPAGLRGPRLAAAGSAAWSWRTTTSGPRSRTRRRRPIPPSRPGSGTLGWYFALADRVSEGRRFLELALAAAGDDAPRRARRSSCSPPSATSRPRSSISTRRSRRASARSRWPRAPLRRGQLGARAPDARARGRAGPGTVSGRAALAQEAFAAFEASGDDWGVAASWRHPRDRRRASRATSRRSPRWRPSSAVTRRPIGYDAFRVPALLLEAWVAERQADGAAAASAYRRAFELAGRIGFADHAAFALAALGSIALARRRPRRGGGARAAGAGRRRGRAGAVGGGARARAARPRRRGGRGRGRRRAALPRGPRVVAGAAAAPGAREPLPRARRQPGRRPPSAGSTTLAAGLSWQQRGAAWQRAGSGGRRAFLSSENGPTGGSR